ncbi:YafY family protein [Intrasporangium sp.]|uniref:helix-turn-helix transcriptional regulator n=1 Tax=Intrasporangium sp. TaxID=1925024 RepID=UPI0032219DA5
MATSTLGPTARILRLLDLLQSRPTWSGTELAERLGVTTRSVRRDVERLRGLGYPVRAEHGAGGGYQLGMGRRLPPLLLDDEEAVAVAVCLRLAAGGTVEGLGEAAVRTLAKLDQVLPARLRSQVEAIHRSTVTLDSLTPSVDATVLLTVARAVRDTERISFSYSAPRGRSERRAEPYRMVATGRRWYLLAYDLEREDWRTFRLDRMTVVRSGGWRFRPREAPDAAEYVRRAITRSGYEHVARVRIAAPRSDVEQVVPASVGILTAAGRQHTILEAGGHDLRWIALHLGALPWDFEVLEPPELVDVVRELGARLARATP